MTELKNIILVSRDGRPSMRNVYSKMNIGNLLVRRKLRNKIYYRFYENNNSNRLTKVKEPDFRNCKVVIRWGTQENINLPEGCIVYNKCNALKNISNKYESRKIMKEAGINVPLNITKSTPQGDIVYPIIARPHFHSKGRHFVTLNNYSQFLQHYNPNSWYYSNFIDKVKEFRIHTFCGRFCRFTR